MNSSCVSDFRARLTLSLLITTIVPYAKSLDPDEMPSNSASHLNPSCLTLKTFSPTLRNTGPLLVDRLRVKAIITASCLSAKGL